MLTFSKSEVIINRNRGRYAIKRRERFPFVSLGIGNGGRGQRSTVQIIGCMYTIFICRRLRIRNMSVALTSGMPEHATFMMKDSVMLRTEIFVHCVARKGTTNTIATLSVTLAQNLIVIYESTRGGTAFHTQKKMSISNKRGSTYQLRQWREICRCQIVGHVCNSVNGHFHGNDIENEKKDG